MVPLVLTYESRLDKSSRTVKERMSFLHIDERLCKIFPDPPLISFCRNRNLRDLLVSARLHTPKTDEQNNEPGLYECPNKKCSVRVLLVTGKKFSSTVTKQSFPINDYLNDKMDWLICLITCKNVECNTLVKRLVHFVIPLFCTDFSAPTFFFCTDFLPRLYFSF